MRTTVPITEATVPTIEATVPIIGAAVHTAIAIRREAVMEIPALQDRREEDLLIGEGKGKVIVRSCNLKDCKYV